MKVRAARQARDEAYPARPGGHAGKKTPFPGDTRTGGEERTAAPFIFVPYMWDLILYFEIFQALI